MNEHIPRNPSNGIPNSFLIVIQAVLRAPCWHLWRILRVKQVALRLVFRGRCKHYLVWIIRFFMLCEVHASFKVEP